MGNLKGSARCRGSGLLFGTNKTVMMYVSIKNAGSMRVIAIAAAADTLLNSILYTDQLQLCNWIGAEISAPWTDPPKKRISM